MNNFEIRNNYLKENNISLSELNESDMSEMLQTWAEFNRMPEITDVNDVKQAVKKALWAAQHEIACWFFIGKEFPANISEWRIGEEILNRSTEKTALGAALDYVDSVIDTVREDNKVLCIG